MLVHRVRRWPNIKSALGHRLMSVDDAEMTVWETAAHFLGVWGGTGQGPASWTGKEPGK